MNQNELDELIERIKALIKEGKKTEFEYGKNAGIEDAIETIREYYTELEKRRY